MKTVICMACQSVVAPTPGSTPILAAVLPPGIWKIDSISVTPGSGSNGPGSQVHVIGTTKSIDVTQSPGQTTVVARWATPDFQGPNNPFTNGCFSPVPHPGIVLSGQIYFDGKSMSLNGFWYIMLVLRKIDKDRIPKLAMESLNSRSMAVHDDLIDL